MLEACENGQGPNIYLQGMYSLQGSLDPFPGKSLPSPLYSALSEKGGGRKGDGHRSS